ncbi:MMPL family transporter [Cryptosporangium sp. NPDC048952]|uniref:MMPL family transporter n=1 Tax=Cryptosporangium sp. NPDC048952 TaxID=3363961 RepID=UPI00371FC691
MPGLRKSSSGVPVVERLAAWSTRHRLAVIVGWLVFVVLAVVLSGLIPGSGARSVDPGESGRAQEVLNAQDDAQGIQESILVQSTDPATLHTAVTALIAALREAEVSAIWAPPGAADAGSANAADAGGRSGAVVTADAARLVGDERSALVTYQVAGPVEGSSARADGVAAVVERVASQHPGTRIVGAGDRSLSQAVDRAIGADVRRSERISLPLTVAILLVVFGALVAAGIPVLLTATALIATFALLQVVDHWLSVNSAANTMVLLIGVAIGVDYALFSLRRVREERAAGHDTVTAVRIAARTSGHVILVSGVVVMLCLSGLLLTGIDVFRGAAVGIVLVVAISVLGALTVLPAVLAALGPRVEWGRLPWLGRRRASGRESAAWARLATAVTRRPVLWGGAAALLLLVLAVPAIPLPGAGTATGLHLQDAAVTDSLPRSVPAIDAATRMDAAFPGASSPARVVIWSDTGARPDLARVRTALSGIDRVTVIPYGDAVLARVPLGGTDDAANRALRELRERTLPAALGEWNHAVAGRTAFAADFTDQLTRRTPYVVAFVLVLAFVLLLLVFRSVRVAAASIGLNLLSIGAACGVLNLVFHGNYGGIVSWLPLFLFVLLFGLSMDYHLFILSRIRERRSIVGGIAASAGVVTSAAVIMTAAFSIFVTLSAIEYRMLGVGAAVAILVDATVVRGVLVPAVLSQLRLYTDGDPAHDHRTGVDTSSGNRQDGVVTAANADG